MSRQPHRIILEGMDGSGKTTLIHMLETEYPQLEVVTRPVDRSFEDWWPAELERQHLDPIPLHDRFFYSELVYGPILRKRLAAPQELIDNVTWFLRNVALLIYCRPASEIIYSEIHRGPQMGGVVDNATALLTNYDHIMAIERSWYGHRFHHYDWTGARAFEEVTKVVDRYLQR